MNQIEDPVPSPCKDDCCLNNDNICLGCFRSLAEIAHWQQMDNSMRLAVLLLAKKRRKEKKNTGAK